MSFARSSIFEAEPLGRNGKSLYETGGESVLVAGIARVARKHARVIALVTLCVCALTAIATFVVPPNYTATAEVIFDPRKNGTADPSAAPELPIDAATAQNQVYILTSRELARRVVTRLNLVDDSEFVDPKAGASAAGNAYDRAVDSLLKRLSVQALGLSTTFSIAVTSRSPHTAAAAANALADAYIEQQVVTKSTAAGVAATWLTERARQLFLDTQKAEAEVEEYKRAHGISEVTSGSEFAANTPLVDEELVALQSQLIQARATLSEKLATQNGLRSLAAQGSAADFSKFTDAPVIIDLRKQESDILQRQADYSQRYGPLHPKMIAVKAELSDIENKIKLEIDRMAHAVDSDVSVAQTQVSTLQNTLHDKEQQALEENLARATLQSLEANAKSTRTAYETFVARLRDAEGQEAMQVPDGSIISRASEPQKPNPPARSLVITASIPIGLLLGLLVALFLERSADAPAEAPVIARLPPVLVRIPKLKRQGVGDSTLAESVVAEPASSFAAAVRTLEALIPRSTPDNGFIVGICSPTASAGSAVLALSLSRAAAQRSRRVVVIDADPAGRLPDLLKITPDRPGLSDVVLSRSPLSASVLHDKLPGLFALAAGRSRDFLARSYGGEPMRALLSYLRKSTDLVVVCLPPLSGMPSGATALTASLDAFVLLIGWNGAPSPSALEVDQAMKALKTKNAGLAVVE